MSDLKLTIDNEKDGIEVAQKYWSKSNLLVTEGRIKNNDHRETKPFEVPHHGRCAVP